MTPDQLLALMQTYFAGKQPAEVLANFPEQTPRALLKESLDVVDFVVYLEEELDREIDLNALGEVLLNRNFGELSQEMARMLEAEG